MAHNLKTVSDKGSFKLPVVREASFYLKIVNFYIQGDYKRNYSLRGFTSFREGLIGGWEEKPCFLVTMAEGPSLYVSQQGDEVVIVESNMSFHEL